MHGAFNIELALANLALVGDSAGAAEIAPLAAQAESDAADLLGLQILGPELGKDLRDERLVVLQLVEHVLDRGGAEAVGDRGAEAEQGASERDEQRAHPTPPSYR